MATKKFILAEKDIPQAWYNVIADMPNKPMSPLNPATKSPLAVEDLYPIFAEELCKQELNTSDAWIEIPEEVRDMYNYGVLLLLSELWGSKKHWILLHTSISRTKV